MLGCVTGCSNVTSADLGPSIVESGNGILSGVMIQKITHSKRKRGEYTSW